MSSLDKIFALEAARRRPPVLEPLDVPTLAYPKGMCIVEQALLPNSRVVHRLLPGHPDTAVVAERLTRAGALFVISFDAADLLLECLRVR